MTTSDGDDQSALKRVTWRASRTFYGVLVSVVMAFICTVGANAETALRLQPVADRDTRPPVQKDYRPHAAQAAAPKQTVSTQADRAATPLPAKPLGPRVQLDVPDSTRQSFARLPDAKRLKILVKLVQSGQHDAAQSLYETRRFDGPFGRNRNLFIEGMIARSRGQNDLAVRYFRAALADDPNLTMVRLQLASTLYEMNEDDGARHHLNLLRAAAPSPELARNFNDFIAAIDARKPWSLHSWISLAPSTNFNNGTSLDTIIIGGFALAPSDLSRSKSGIGIKGGSNVAYTHDLGDQLKAIIAGGTYYEQYEGNIFDKFVLSQNLEFRRYHAKGSIGIGLAASQSWYRTATANGETAQETLLAIGPQLTIRHLLVPQVTLETRLSHMINDYNIADHVDGFSAGISNRLAWSVSPSRVMYAMFGGDRQQTRRSHLDTWAGWGGLGIYQEIPWGLTIYAEGKVRYALSDGDYPLLGEQREQTRVNGRATLTKRDFEIWGLAPQLEYTYARNFSNDELSRFEAHGMNFTLTRDF